MFDIIQQILAFAVTLGLIVTIHEWGHFWVARRCGVFVERFSIGFGPVLFRKKDKIGTEYCIAALPLGGYVKMLDDTEGELPADMRHQAHTHKTVWQRMAIAAAGPAANFILAAFVFWLLAMMGSTAVKPVVGAVAEGSVAQGLGLTEQQQIVAIDQKEVTTWSDVSQALLARMGDTGTINTKSRYLDSDFIYEAEYEINGFMSGDNVVNPLAEFGVTPYRPKVEVVFSSVADDYPAANAGLMAGDRVILTNGNLAEDWYAWAELIQQSGGQSLQLVIDRAGAQLEVVVHPKQDADGVYRIGVAPVVPKFEDSMLIEQRWGPVAAVGRGLQQTYDMSVFVVDSARKMLTGLISTKNLSGPITIAKVASTSVDYGLYSWLSIVALLSVSIGVLNLLPIPVLDGGHLVFLAVEAIKGSPVSQRIQIIGYQAGFALIMGVMALALYNDIARLG